MKDSFTQNLVETKNSAEQAVAEVQDQECQNVVEMEDGFVQNCAVQAETGTQFNPETKNSSM